MMTHGYVKFCLFLKGKVFDVHIPAGKCWGLEACDYVDLSSVFADLKHSPPCLLEVILGDFLRILTL